MVQILAFTIISLLALPGIHATCSGDNCLRALQAPAVVSSAVAFCSSFTGAPGFQGTIPAYASPCSVTKIKSACACLPTASVTHTTSTTSSTSSTTSTTSTSSPSITPTSSTCPAPSTVTVTQPTTITLTQAAVISDITITSDITLPPSTVDVTVTSDITLCEPPSTITVTVTSVTGGTVTVTTTESTTVTTTCTPDCNAGLVNGGWESDAFGPWFFTPANRLYLGITPTTTETLSIQGCVNEQICPFEGNWMLVNPDQIGISQTFTVCRGTTTVSMSIEIARLNMVNCGVVISLWDEQAGASLGPDQTAIPATAFNDQWLNFQTFWFLEPAYGFDSNYTLAVEVDCTSDLNNPYFIYLDAASVSFS